MTYIIGWIIAAIALMVGSKYAAYWITESSSIPQEFMLNGYLPYVIIALMWAIYAAIFFVTTRDRNYNRLTGRSYSYDHSHYQRTYGELVEYFSHAEPHKMAVDSFPTCDWRSYQGLIFGTSNGHLVALPGDTEGNIAVFGPPGSGKTAGLAIINAMQFPGAVLAIDVKGDIYAYVHTHSSRKILRFCPDDPDALRVSCHFNPLAGLNKMTETEQKLFIENLATILVPEEGGNEGNYFTTRARKLFQGIAFLLLYQKGSSLSFPDIVHAILEGNVFDWVNEAIDGNCQPAKELLSSFWGNNEKNISGAYDALTTALIHFSNPVLDTLLSPGGGHCICNRDLDRGYDIYLQISQEHLDAYAPIFTMIVQNFSTGFTRRPDKSSGVKCRPVLMILDEFPQLVFSYKMINSDLSTLRSKSVICMIIQQNLSQLDYRYQPTGERSIIGNCNFQVILGCNDITSGKVFSDQFGMKRVLRRSNSIAPSHQAMGTSSVGISVQETTEKVYPPESFGDLSARNALIFYCKGKYAELKKLNCYHE